MTLLALETSCDDTAAAVWTGDAAPGGPLRGCVTSSIVAGQDVHALWGGVVPELASRDHQRLVVPVVRAALAEAGVALADLDAVAVTYGPGLAGSLLVGLSLAKGLALGLGVPLVGVNHLDGHVYSVFAGSEPATDAPGPAFPFLCLTVSGGHTHLHLVRDGFRHELLGATRDDAAGEAFDKVAKLLGLPYPGGPHVDRLAAEGDAAWMRLPSPRLAGKHGERPLFDVSFSGLKTAVRYRLDAEPEAAREAFVERHRNDLCASFQHTVVRALVDALREAVRRTGVPRVAVVGGVSANRGLRAVLEDAAATDGFEVFLPEPRFSVDNAAMIAVAAAHRLAAGETSPLDLRAQPSLAL